MEELLNIKGLNLKIENKVLLKNFNFSISRGIRIGITGPSGCGKTTLLRSIISGIFPNHSTVKSFDKTNINKIGYIPQSDGLLPWFTVKKILNVFVDNSISDINSFTKELDIENCINSFPNEISGGENQRVLLCCSIISKPDLFIADEPLTEIDLEKKWRILKYWSKIITDINASLLIVSHDVDTLTYMCDEIILLSDKPSTILKTIINKSSYPRNQNDLINSQIRKEIYQSLLHHKT